MEKKCKNCKHMDICKMYLDLVEMAIMLNTNMRKNDLGETGYMVMVNTLAHDCTRFEAFKEEVPVKL